MLFCQHVPASSRLRIRCMKSPRFLQAWAGWLYRFRRWGIPLLLLVWALGALDLISDTRPLPWMKTGGASQSEAAQVNMALREDFGLRLENSAGIVLEREHAAIPELMARLRHVAGVKELRQIPPRGGTPPAQRRLYYLQFEIGMPLSEAEDRVADLRAISHAWSTRYGVKTWITGDQAFAFDVDESGKHDAARSEKWGLSLACLVLIFCFGSLTAAALPLVLGATTLLTTQVLLRLLWIGTDHATMILDSMVGLGLTIDYSLFMLSRYREERLTRAPAEALGIVLRHTGRTVLYSAGVMILSLLVLLIPEVAGLRGTVQNLLLVIVLSAWNALTLLPLLLVALDGVLDRPRWLSRLILRGHSEARWHRVATAVTAHPVRYALLALLILGALALPMRDLKLWEPRQSLAPAGSESVAGFDALADDGWGGELLPVQVLVYAPPGHSLLEDAELAKLYALAQGLEALPEVASVQGLVTGQRPLADYLALYRPLRVLAAGGLAPWPPLLRETPQGQVTLINIQQRNLMRVEQTYPILHWLEDYRRQHPDMHLLAGGVVARAHSFTIEMYRYLWPMLALILIAILGLLSFYLRSLLLPIKAGVMNFLPILSGFGILVWAFQWGGLATARPGITNIVPMTLFCIVFGLSMDYEVLILSRIDETWRETGDVRQAVVSGLSRSSGIITGAALILLGVFAPGILSPSPVVQEISLGISVTILIDATLVRLLLVPSLMMLMGKWNWWHPFSKTAAAAEASAAGIEKPNPGR